MSFEFMKVTEECVTSGSRAVNKDGLYQYYRLVLPTFFAVRHHRYSYELNIHSQRLSVKQFRIHRPTKYELFAALTSRTAVFRLDTVCQPFGGTYCLHLQGRFFQVIGCHKPEESNIILKRSRIPPHTQFSILMRVRRN